MVKFPKIRGMEDRYDLEAKNLLFLKSFFGFLAENSGYKPFITPIMENADLFIRSVGDTSDIVTKEFYDFKDKGDRHIVLRPEGTAGVIRGLIEDKIIYSKQLPVKVYYSGEMFRYERPQSGRLRQFNQFGVECVGTNSVYDDADMLVLADSCIRQTGVKDYKIYINNIGNYESRSKWINELKSYFKKYKNELTEDSVNRIETNPLRILDDKVDGKKEFVKKAPKIDTFLTKQEKEDFNKIVTVLKEMKIEFTIDDTLVRGLDYYTNFVFEIVSTRKELTGQPTLAGGGRYSYLVKELGGSDLSCSGFAIGLERLLIQINAENVKINSEQSVDVCLACIYNDPQAIKIAFIISNILKSSNISCICNFDSTKLEKHFKYAKDNNAKFVIILGEKEFKSNSFIIKDQKTLKQETVNLKDLIEYMKGKLK